MVDQNRLIKLFVAFQILM